MSFEVDHIVALANGGTDTLDNKQPAHRHCNREKWHKIPAPPAPRVYVTTRSW